MLRLCRFLIVVFCLEVVTEAHLTESCWAIDVGVKAASSLIDQSEVIRSRRCVLDWTNERRVAKDRVMGTNVV